MSPSATSFASFADVETTSAVAASSADVNDEVRSAVREMVLYRDSIERVAGESQSELATFWLRKTRKPVLAILVVQKGASGKRVFYRGLNLEVSMPTGSLCAERNAIGNALAADPTLTRQDLRLVAVLSLNKLVLGDAAAACGGGGAASPAAESAAGPEARLETIPEGAASGGGGATAAPTSPTASSAPRRKRRKRPRSNSLSEGPESPHPRVAWSRPGGSPRAAALVAARGAPNGAARHSNPLEPCGACCEWLRRIARVSPGFRIVTFTDLSCKEVHVKTVD